MTKIRIIHSKIEKYLYSHRDIVRNGYMPKYHAVLCDPPYFLSSIVKRFGKKSSAPAKQGTDGAFARASRGFMGQTWDGFESSQDFQKWVTVWAEMMLDFVYPGAVLMAFGGTRTYHRLVCGLEDAGWEIYDSIATWNYGSGMPKSYNLHKVDDPAWSGFGTGLKPSYEPIVVARAPRQGYTFDQCATQFGSGALNIDGCRLESGRYPANTMLVHHPDCTDNSCVMGCHVLEMAMQSGHARSGSSLSGNEPGNVHSDKIYFRRGRVPFEGYNDVGTAARFFYQAKSPSWERSEGLNDKNPHPTIKPVELLEKLALMIKPPIDNARLLVPFCGSGSEIIGAYLAGWKNITGIEMTPEYIPVAKARLKWWSRFNSYGEAKSHHDLQTKVENESKKSGHPVWEQKTLWEIRR